MKALKIIMALLLLFGSFSAAAEVLITLDTRSGVKQRFILIKPQQPPTASVILFAGGKGALDLSSFFGATTIGWGKNNFLVRTRELFAQQGLMVAVVDAPSDRQSKKGMIGGFRASSEHVADTDNVIRYLQNEADVPVWLVGTSRGTESATNIAINSAADPAGLVLTSSMSVRNAKGTTVTEMALDQIAIPTLIVAHEDDQCQKTPPNGAHEIASMLPNAKKVEVKLFSGGDRPKSKPCQAMSYHGFLGIEEQVVQYIAEFITSD